MERKASGLTMTDLPIQGWLEGIRGLIVEDTPIPPAIPSPGSKSPSPPL
jgi:hypothetical protein